MVFGDIADQLSMNEVKITAELLAAQGEPVDIDGCYVPSNDKAANAMRPSDTLNNILFIATKFSN